MRERERERERETQTDRQTDRQRDRETERDLADAGVTQHHQEEHVGEDTVDSGLDVLPPHLPRTVH